MSLLNDAKAGNAKLYLQFGGQGAPWYKELVKYYQEGNMKTFFDAAIAAIDEERPVVEGTIGLPHGINIRSWLDDESTIPSEEYLSCAAVSIPMIEMTQLAHYEKLIQSGISRAELVTAAAGTSGHSQGLIPATLSAMGIEGEDYYAEMKKYIKYLLYLGVRCQEVYTEFEASPEEKSEAEELGSANPSPMVAVLGEEHEFIEGLVKETNANLPAEKQIYISLYNTPNNRILSSFRSSLIAFHRQHKAVLDEKKIKFVYLRTTCPFHSPLLEAIKAPIEEDIQRIGFSYTGSELKVPVYSFYDGKNLQDESEIAIKLYQDMALNTLYWKKSMVPVVNDNSITHILDFGPGKTSQRLSQETLQAENCSTPVLAVAFPKDLKAITGA